MNHSILPVRQRLTITAALGFLVPTAPTLASPEAFPWSPPGSSRAPRYRSTKHLAPLTKTNSLTLAKSTSLPLSKYRQSRTKQMP